MTIKGSSYFLAERKRLKRKDYEMMCYELSKQSYEHLRQQ
jgi:hypothetical protein